MMSLLRKVETEDGLSVQDQMTLDGVHLAKKESRRKLSGFYHQKKSSQPDDFFAY